MSKTPLAEISTAWQQDRSDLYMPQEPAVARRPTAIFGPGNFRAWATKRAAGLCSVYIQHLYKFQTYSQS